MINITGFFVYIEKDRKEMMQAEPNKTKSKLRVLDLEVSNTFSDKILMKVEVLPSEEQEDKRFIKQGEIMQAFTYETVNITPNAVLLADAEFIGGPGGGNIYLTNIQII